MRDDAGSSKDNGVGSCSRILDPASSLAIALLIFSLLLVIAFEATNGFHYAANSCRYSDLHQVAHASTSGGVVRRFA